MAAFYRHAAVQGADDGQADPDGAPDLAKLSKTALAGAGQHRCRDDSFAEEGAVVVHSVAEGIRRAGDADELCVIGGGQIYAQMMDRADRLDITHVLATLEGDTLFPDIDPSIWRLASEERFAAGERDDHETLFAVYERRR